MRHNKAGVKLNRTTSHRQAMFRNMVTSLFKYNRIRTTDVKAKELRRWADHMITLAKRGDLHARRQAMAVIREKDVVHKLFEEAQRRFGDVNGGYTRIVKIGRRPGDAAPISLIELIHIDKKTSKKKKKSTAAKKKASKAKQEPAATKDEAQAEGRTVGTESDDAASEPEEDAIKTVEAADSQSGNDKPDDVEPKQAAEAEAASEGDADAESPADETGQEEPDTKA